MPLDIYALILQGMNMSCHQPQTSSFKSALRQILHIYLTHSSSFQQSFHGYIRMVYTLAFYREIVQLILRNTANAP